MSRYDGVQFELCEACWAKNPNRARPWNLSVGEVETLLRDCPRCFERLRQWTLGRKVQLMSPGSSTYAKSRR